MKVKFFFNNLIIILFVLCFIACSTNKNMIREGKSNAQLTETYWKLVEIFGKKVELNPGQKEAHIILKAEQNRIMGNSSCNNFHGYYEILDNNNIQFSKVASTRMGCLDMEVENNMFKIFDEINRYMITGNTLVFMNKKLDTVAIFEAVYLR
jgi:heat shock protein HslJ